MPWASPNIAAALEQDALAPTWVAAHTALTVDIDPSISSSYTIATGVSSITNQAPGGGTFVQATGAQQPTIQASGINGLPSLAFSVLNQNLTSAKLLSATLSTSAFVIFIVLQNTTIPTDINTTWYQNAPIFSDGYNQNFAVSQRATGPAGNCVLWDGAEKVVNSHAGVTEPALLTPMLLMATLSAGTLTFQVNNNAAQTTAGIGSLTLGANGISIATPTALKYFNGLISRVLVYNAYNASDVAANRAGIKARWNLW